MCGWIISKNKVLTLSCSVIYNHCTVKHLLVFSPWLLWFVKLVMSSWLLLLLLTCYCVFMDRQTLLVLRQLIETFYCMIHEAQHHCARLSFSIFLLSGHYNTVFLSFSICNYAVKRHGCRCAYQGSYRSWKSLEDILGNFQGLEKSGKWS